MLRSSPLPLLLVSWSDIFTDNALVVVGVVFLIVIGIIVIRFLSWVQNAILGLVREHINHINAMADLVPDIKREMDKLTTQASEMKTQIIGIRYDIQHETDLKLKVQKKSDKALDERLRRIERHNLHDLRNYMQALTQNLERLVDHMNRATSLVGVGIVPFEVKMPVLRAPADRRQYEVLETVEEDEDGDEP